MAVTLTPKKALVLDVFLEDPSAEHHGYEVLTATQLASGSVYVMLAEFEEAKVLTVRSEQVQGRRGPRMRYYYKLDPDMIADAREARREVRRQQSSARRPGQRLPVIGVHGAPS